MNNKPDYIFFGTPEFAEIVLKKMIEAGMPPASVVCNPDKPVGRKKIITSPPTKILAQKYGIPVFQPENLRDLKINKANFAIVAAYSKIIPKDLINAFELGIVGVHPSLLPKYRGATPIQTAILNGEKETGVTLYSIDEKVDHGAIISASKLPVSDFDTYETLEKKLAEAAGDLLIKTIPEFINGKIKLEPQDESRATFTKKFETKDAQVDLEKDSPVEIERKVRALNPEPGVFTLSKSNGSKGGPKRMKILEAEIGPPTDGGKLIFKKIQYEGKKPQIVN